MLSLVTEWKQLFILCSQVSRITANREEERYSMVVYPNSMGSCGNGFTVAVSLWCRGKNL